MPTKGQAQYFTCVIFNYLCKMDEQWNFYVRRKKVEGMECPETFQ